MFGWHGDLVLGRPFWVSHGAAPKEEGSLQVEMPLVSKVNWHSLELARK